MSERRETSISANRERGPSGPAPQVPRAGRVSRTRPVLIYVLVGIVGAAAFLYPFWLPSEALPARAHAVDAPLWAALVGALVAPAAVEAAPHEALVALGYRSAEFPYDCFC